MTTKTTTTPRAMTVRDLYERLGRIIADHEQRAGNPIDRRMLGVESRLDLPVIVRQRRRSADGKILADRWARAVSVAGCISLSTSHYGVEITIDAAPVAQDKLDEAVRS